MGFRRPDAAGLARGVPRSPAPRARRPTPVRHSKQTPAAVSLLARRGLMGPDAATLLGLHELVAYGLRGVAAYAHHAEVTGPPFFRPRPSFGGGFDPCVARPVLFCCHCSRGCLPHHLAISV